VLPDDDNFTKQDKDNFDDDTVKKPADDEDEVDNSQPAGDEFLIWEPKSFGEKIKNFLWNMMEANTVIAIALVAYNHASTNSLVYFLAYLTLFYPMSKDIKERYKWNLIICIALLVMEFIAIFCKKKDEKYFTDAVFKKSEYNKYQY
jgi:hypothetical protein